MTWETYDQFQKHTLGFYKIFIERKFVDVLDRPTVAINICHSIAKCQCLTAKTIQNRHRRQWKFHCKALVGTEVCRDNTAFTVNFSRGHSKKAGQGTQGNNQCTALSSIC